MTKFRKKPVVIEAFQLTEQCEIKTLNGPVIAEPGEWLITGIAGEQYPCANHIFKETYEPVDGSEWGRYYPMFPLHVRRFRLNRLEDVTNVSGTGIIAVGVQFYDSVVLYWPKSRSTAVFPNLDEMVKVHGHGGKTVVEWLD